MKQSQSACAVEEVMGLKVRTLQEQIFEMKNTIDEKSKQIEGIQERFEAQEEKYREALNALQEQEDRR